MPVTFHSDEKGYFDRECPNENCLYMFKVHMEDWEDKFSDDTVYCPLCGHVADVDSWWTQEQLRDMEELVEQWAVSYMQSELDKTFGELARSTRGDKFFQVTYTPDKPITFINNPLGQSAEWEQEIVCPYCHSRYSVIGTAYFCPCCGKNTVLENFDNSLDNVGVMLNSLPEMQKMLATSCDENQAQSICTTMIENSLGDIISAFQKFAEEKYKSISNKPTRVNDFQIVSKGSQLFAEEKGIGYEKWLSQNELAELNRLFQKRHLIEHNGGIVDEVYLKKSQDSSYSIGQRLIIRKDDVEQLLALMKKLSDGILAL